jgi:hypothetical protein
MPQCPMPECQTTAGCKCAPPRLSPAGDAAHIRKLETALRDVVTTWRNGDVVGGHEAIGRAEDLLKSAVSR